MYKNYRQLYQSYYSGQLTTSQFLKEIKSLYETYDLSDDLVQSIYDQEKKQNWNCIQGLILGILSNPSKKFTTVLCHLLDNYKSVLNIEDIIDLLFDIKDEASVPSIIIALDYSVVGDDYYHFNRKCLQVLAEIGDEKAVSALKTALNNDRKEIKDEALRLLAKLHI